MLGRHIRRQLLSLSLLVVNFADPFPLRFPLKRSLNYYCLRKMSNDEFGGDDAFLASFDLEQAVAEASSPQPSDPKRRKISPDGIKKTSDVSVPALEATLSKYFGYSGFRPGQLPVIQAVMSGRDAAVLWATGRGKSMTFQIPALHHENRTVLVVSPLVALMQDQVRALNFRQQEQVATYLGSSQTDPTQEARALNGEFRLVYVTPEKLVSGFLPKIGHLLSLVAVDEAHCVSEWGHDFRPDYRLVGETLRKHNKAPILALTATAVPRVRDDIVESLGLRNPLIHQTSLARSNLHLSILPRKKSFEGIWNWLETEQRDGSVIIYAPTRSLVDDIGKFLQTKLPPEQVATYHAGQAAANRTATHNAFLTGQAKFIVATVAFGMGIDKPDIRAVVHYEAPQTLEAYYQQIGRAGRDGIDSKCVVFMNPSDMDRYKSDFYLGKLSPQARETTIKSMDAMRNFCMERETCRRQQILKYFVQDQGEPCGKCDVCVNTETYGDDFSRDFLPEVKLVGMVATRLHPQGLTNIVKAVSGEQLEEYRYKSSTPSDVVSLVQKQRGLLTEQRTKQFFKELVPIMAQQGLLSQSSKSGDVGGFKRTWTVFEAKPKLRQALNQDEPILLPVPDCVREADQKAELKRQETLALLTSNGISADKLPDDEILKGDGEVIRAYSKWYNYRERLLSSDRQERVSQLDALLEDIESWRSATAIEFITSPAAVLAEHIVASLAYATASLPPGIKLSKEALLEVGVRAQGCDQLLGKLSDWVDTYQPAPTGECSDRKMELSLVQPNNAWEFASYKPSKKTGLATWESSYLRFRKGESLQAIAMSPASGRPIQVNTVVGHVFDALVQGRQVDLRELAKYSRPPSEIEWNRLRDECEAISSVVSDPDSSGPNGEKLTITEFLRPLMGDDFVAKPYSERSEEETEQFRYWCSLYKWYTSLRRVGYEPTFA